MSNNGSDKPDEYEAIFEDSQNDSSESVPTQQDVGTTSYVDVEPIESSSVIDLDSPYKGDSSDTLDADIEDGIFAPERREKKTGKKSSPLMVAVSLLAFIGVGAFVYTSNPDLIAKITQNLSSNDEVVIPNDVAGNPSESTDAQSVETSVVDNAVVTDTPADSSETTANSNVTLSQDDQPEEIVTPTVDTSEIVETIGNTPVVEESEHVKAEDVTTVTPDAQVSVPNVQSSEMVPLVQPDVTSVDTVPVTPSANLTKDVQTPSVENTTTGGVNTVTDVTTITATPATPEANDVKEASISSAEKITESVSVVPTSDTSKSVDVPAQAETPPASLVDEPIIQSTTPISANEVPSLAAQDSPATVPVTEAAAPLKSSALENPPSNDVAAPPVIAPSVPSSEELEQVAKDEASKPKIEPDSPVIVASEEEKKVIDDAKLDKYFDSPSGKMLKDIPAPSMDPKKGSRESIIIVHKADEKPASPVSKKSKKMKIETTTLDTKMVSADRALKLGRYEAAKEMYDELYSLSPRDARVLSGRALLLQKMGNEERAISAYEELLSVYPNNVDAVVNLSGLIRKKYPAEALGKLLDLHASHPDNVGVTAQLGIAYADSGNYQDAMRYLQSAVSLDTNNPLHYFNMAVISDRAKDYRHAVEYYEKALEVDAIYGDGKKLPAKEKIYDRLAEIRGN